MQQLAKPTNNIKAEAGTCKGKQIKQLTL